MVTQLRAMSLSTSSVELYVAEGLSVDSFKEVNWLPWLWGKVLAIGDEAAGMIDW